MPHPFTTSLHVHVHSHNQTRQAATGMQGCRVAANLTDTTKVCERIYLIWPANPCAAAAAAIPPGGRDHRHRHRRYRRRHQPFGKSIPTIVNHSLKSLSQRVIHLKQKLSYFPNWPVISSRASASNERKIRAAAAAAQTRQSKKQP